MSIAKSGENVGWPRVSAGLDFKAFDAAAFLRRHEDEVALDIALVAERSGNLAKRVPCAAARKRQDGHGQYQAHPWVARGSDSGALRLLFLFRIDTGMYNRILLFVQLGTVLPTQPSARKGLEHRSEWD